MEESLLQLKFQETVFKTGYLVINCADEATEEWLCRVIPDLKPLEDAKLKALKGGSDLPKSLIFNVFFPNSAEDNNEKILRLIRVQNKSLCMTNWRVLKRGRD